MNQYNASKKANILPLIGVWFLITLLWGVYRYVTHFSESWDEIVFKPIIFILPVILYLKQNNTLSLASLGFRSTRIQLIIKWGVILGMLLVLENIIIWRFKGHEFIQAQYQASALFVNGLISLSTSISEEILYRGFLMEQIWQVTKRINLAHVTSTFHFGVAHLGIAVFVFHYAQGELVAYIVLILVLGYAQGLIYKHTRSIYATIIAHALWNFSNVLL